MGEGTADGGGNTVPTCFSNAVIHYVREYCGLLSAFELWRSDGGEAYNRAAYSEFGSGATATENTTFTEGPEPT